MTFYIGANRGSALIFLLLLNNLEEPMCVGLASTSLVPLDTIVESHIQQADRLDVVGWHQQPCRLRPVSMMSGIVQW
ncbi:hypothetical protein VPH35_129407 [Triticum aestivum]